MAKLERDELLRRGEQLLADWGAAADATALGACAHREPAADAAIAARLGALPETASVALLQAIESRSRDKHVRKEVRRSLYRLQQRGVVIQAPEPAVKPAPVLRPQLEGYLSAVDGRGDQLVWLVRPVPGGIAHLLAVINDPDGMREVDLSHTTRKALRAARQDLERKHDIRMVEADWRYCDFLMDRAFRWARERGTALTGDYPGLRAQIVKEPAPTDLPPLVWSILDAEAIRADPAALAQSAALLEEKEFRTWIFDEAALRPYLEQMLQVKDSPLVLSAAQQQERFRVTVERAVEELFSGDRQQSWPRRLYEMAYYFARTQRHESARRAGAVALALAASAHGGRDIPLCEHLARGSLAAFLHVISEREEEQARSSLIVTPQQAAQAAQQRRR